jgi:hypothetical protein
MRIIHRISVASSTTIQADLAAAGIEVPAAGMATFEIDQTDPAWPTVAEWAARHQPLDLVRTEFAPAEIDAAGWLELQPGWHHGYPQPKENSFGFRAATYDLADFCQECGVGLAQRAPFQMKAEPPWGGRGMLQLNWVFDEYFTTPAVWETVFAPFGVPRRPVLHRTGAELTTVVQLVVDEPVPVVVDGPPSQQCPRCQRTKFLPVKAGPFPALEREPSGPVARTSQYFGSGGSAFRPVLLRSDLARALTRAKVRGMLLRPLHDRQRQ